MAVPENHTVVERLLRELADDPNLAFQLASKLGFVAVAREEFAALIGEVRSLAATVREHSRRLEEMNRVLQDHGRRLEELTRAVEKQGERLEEMNRVLQDHGRRLEEHGRRLDQHGRIIEELGRRVETAFRHVDALGARWGFKSEAAFRNGLREVLSRRFGVSVERWQHEDRSGEVFGVPTSVELDVVVRDGEPLLIEVKSQVSVADVAAFRRKADLYDRLHGTRSTRLIVSPAVDDRAAEFAARSGVGISTDLS